MSFDIAVNIDLDRAINAKRFEVPSSLRFWMWVFVCVGVMTFTFAIFDPNVSWEHIWGSYFINLLFWMGIALGSCIAPVIFQIVRARWAGPVRRIAEANLGFLPWAYFLFLCTYFGKEYLYPWAREPMPGREWWMQPNFVYVRFALLLFLLFWLICRFTRMSLRGDIGLLREQAKDKTIWQGWIYKFLTSDWKGTSKEVAELQPRMSWNAPLIILAYVLIYSVFAFEMVMGMDTIWFSNMYGGFIFIGNIYMGWAAIALWCMYLASKNADYRSMLGKQQLWDLGKLTFGFCMLWTYMFFSQFLPQWYGNLPEETQWLILRTRDYPWRTIAYTAFGMCFIVPFIVLLSEDVKRIPRAFASICVVILLGMWLEKYVTVMPTFFPSVVPFSFVEIGFFLGFMGVYVLSVSDFLSRFPFIPVSHPATVGNVNW